MVAKNPPLAEASRVEAPQFKSPQVEAPWFDIIDRQALHTGFINLDAYSVRQRRFDGGMSPMLHREVMIAREAVAVILFDPDRDKVVLIEQVRLPALLADFPALSREIVSGLIEAGEEPAAVARREVQEEAGLDLIGDPHFIIRMLVSPGNTTQTVQMFCGRVDSRDAAGVHGLAEEHEDIRIVLLDLEQFRQDLRSGKTDNAIALVAGFWLFDNLDRLRQMWPPR